MRKIFLIISFIILALTSCKQKDKVVITQDNSEILILNDGSEYKGKLQEITKEKVVFIVNDESKEYPISEVNKVSFQKKRKHSATSSVTEIKDNFIINAWKESKKIKQKNDNKFEVISDETIYDINDKTITKTTRIALKVLTKEGKQEANRYFYYFNDAIKSELSYAITIYPDGTIYKSDEEAINDEPIYSAYPTYDRLRRKKFSFKKADVNSVLVYQFVTEYLYDNISHPLFVNKSLKSTINMRMQKVTINSDKELVYNIKKGEMKYNNVKVKSSNNTISFTQKNLKKLKIDETSLPSFEMIIPSLNVTHKLSWNELSKLYYERYLNNNDSGYIKDFIKKSNSSVDTLENIKKIYNLINTQIGLAEISVNGIAYKVSSDETITTSNFLNSMDKSVLFTKVLNNLGVYSSILFYKNNLTGKTSNQTPSLYQFTNVLVLLRYNGQEYKVSFDNNNYAFNQIPDSSNNSSYLEISKDGSDINTLSTIPNTLNRSDITYECILDNNNNMSITKKTTIKGINQASFRAKRFLPEQYMINFFKSRISSISSNAVLKSYNFLNELSDFDKDVVVEEEISIPNYSFTSGKNIKLFRLPDFMFDASDVNKKSRKYSFDAGMPGVITQKYSIEIPEGFKIFSLPKNIDIKNENFNVAVNFSSSENYIKVFIKLETINRIINKSDYKALKNFYETFAKSSESYIALEGNNE